MIGGAYEKIFIYPGSFDPITNGHVDVIELLLYAIIGVAVLVNSNKKTV